MDYLRLLKPVLRLLAEDIIRVPLKVQILFLRRAAAPSISRTYLSTGCDSVLEEACVLVNISEVRLQKHVRVCKSVCMCALELLC